VLVVGSVLTVKVVILKVFFAKIAIIIWRK